MTRARPMLASRGTPAASVKRKTAGAASTDSGQFFRPGCGEGANAAAGSSGWRRIRTARRDLDALKGPETSGEAPGEACRAENHHATSTTGPAMHGGSAVPLQGWSRTRRCSDVSSRGRRGWQRDGECRCGNSRWPLWATVQANRTGRSFGRCPDARRGAGVLRRKGQQ